MNVHLCRRDAKQPPYECVSRSTQRLSVHFAQSRTAWFYLSTSCLQVGRLLVGLRSSSIVCGGAVGGGEKGAVCGFVSARGRCCWYLWNKRGVNLAGATAEGRAGQQPTQVNDQKMSGRLVFQAKVSSLLTCLHQGSGLADTSPFPTGCFTGPSCGPRQPTTPLPGYDAITSVTWCSARIHYFCFTAAVLPTICLA